MARQRIYYRGTERKAGRLKGQADFIFIREWKKFGEAQLPKEYVRQRVKVDEEEIFQDKYYENLARGVKISLGSECFDKATIAPPLLVAEPDLTEEELNEIYEEHGHYGEYQLRYVLYKGKKYEILRMNRMARNRMWLDLEEVK